MAQILVYPDADTRKKPSRAQFGPGQIVIFPGIRVEYHDDATTVDLSKRYPPAGQNRTLYSSAG